MKVIEFKPLAWFLVENDGELYIDVNCQSGFSGFSVVVQLNASEKMHYKNRGIRFIENLGSVIAEKSDYNHPRNIKDKSLIDEVYKAILAWYESHTAGPL